MILNGLKYSFRLKKKTNLIILFISSLCFIAKTQTTNTAMGCFVIKANVGVFYDNDEKRLSRGNPNYNYEVGKYGPPVPYASFTQIFGKPNVFIGNEIDYYFPRSNFFGINIGLAYSYDKTYYTHNSHDRKNNFYTNSFIDINGSGSFNNNMIKLVFGLNFNTKSGFNFYLQILNPEVRIIKDCKSIVTHNTYNGYYKSVYGQDYQLRDSTSTLVSSETKNFEFTNYKTGANFSIAFASLIGVEQKFKIGKLNYVAGASAAFSALEWYAIYRVHFGICLVVLNLYQVYLGINYFNPKKS